MSDRIILRGIRIQALIGILDEEQHSQQELVVSVVVHTPFTRIQQSDQIQDGVDYREVISACRQFSLCHHSKTLEHFTHHLALHLKQTFAAQQIELTIEKNRYAKDLGVEHIEAYVCR